MKKTIIIIAILFNINLFADKAFNQIIKCETAAGSHKSIKNANPQICIDATNLYKEKKNLTTYEKGYYGESYYNAAIIYSYGEKFKNLKKAYEMFMKSYNVNYDKSSLFNSIGVCHNEGKGTKVNKFKAYKFFMKAARLGDEYAQINLDKLCKNSSWACK